MSKAHEQIKHMMRNGKAHMDFLIRRKMPDAIKPASPLITYLESKSPLERSRMVNVKLGSSLGYESGAAFDSGASMLRYLKPKVWVVGSWPARSCQNLSFRTVINDELFETVQKKGEG